MKTAAPHNYTSRMKSGQASRTAEYMALFRALETTRPRRVRLFEDPLAAAFLAPNLRAVVGLSRVPWLGDCLRGYIDQRWPGVRTSGVARTRYIDEVLASALGEGVEQIVILGAGFDSRPYRMSALAQVLVFEVDHPATSAAKRIAIEKHFGNRPAHVCYVPIDFDSTTLAEAMASAGYDTQRRSFFLWEGVTNYLNESAVDKTLRFCAGAARGSTVVFTYIHRDVLDAPGTFSGTEQIIATLHATGERWTFGIHPAQLKGFLAQRGLTLQSDCGATDYRAQYYGPAAARMHGYEFYRIAVAKV